MSPSSEVSIPGVSFGLRTKLTLGFVVLLVILLAVGVESITLLDRLGGSIDVILRENYKSVIACEQMKEALERMDSGALFALAGETLQASALEAQNRPRFEEALKTELGNITLPEEGGRAARLQQLYQVYGPVLQQVLNPENPLAQRRAVYFQKLYPTFQQIKTAADEILQMNQENMMQAKVRARETADDASRRMAVLLLVGFACAGIAVFFLSRAILGPLERLTWAAGELEKGNLDLAVAQTSGDELGHLAASFNAMAAGLRELRETDQARLLRAQRMAQAAIDKLPEAVAVVSRDRRVELANHAASSLLGLSPGEPLPEQHHDWLLPLLGRIESGILPPREGESLVRLAIEGHERLFLPRGAALANGHGRAGSVALVLEDVTDRYRGGQVHARLLANAARDLEGSLAVLEGALEALDSERSGPVTPHQKQRLGTARTAAERLAEVAANLKGMSMVEESRQQLHPEPVPPGELIDSAVREAAAGFREDQVKLTSAVNPEAPRVLADREQAQIVLSSLLRNARAHTAAGGEVTVAAEPWKGRVRFTVTDTGSGIPSAHVERIFEPFYQVPGTQDLGGVGLGLTLAQKVVQSHGGEIRCESEEGRGAKFWFTLPAAQ